VRNEHGRRVGDRRAQASATAAPALPSGLHWPAAEVRFVRVKPLSKRERENLRALQLVVRFQAGDQHAFSELYAQCSGWVTAYCTRDLSDAHEAEDVVQKVGLSLLRGLPRYEVRPGVPFEAWLRQVTHNHVVDCLRRQDHLRLMEPAEVFARLDRQGHAPEASERANSYDLDAALAKIGLSEDQRQVLRLRYIFDLAPAQIAATLDKTEEAVAMTHYRAMKTLRQRFTEPAVAQHMLRASMRRLNPRLPVVQARRMALAVCR
jgi:RNA polymerase sigma-70 factor (ECF subfamily)